MECLVNSLIYLLAIMGIVFTTMSFWEMFRIKSSDKIEERVYGKGNKKVQIIVVLEEENEESDALLSKIRSGDAINLKENANTIIIQKRNNV